MSFILLLAVIPAVIIMFNVRKLDKAEPEPRGLLAKLFIFGALTVISAVLLGMVAEALNIFDEGTTAYILFDNFIATALIEEGGKYFVLKKCTWKHPAFNYTFDAVVYAITVSLGFATVENIFYVMDGDIVTALMRAVLSVPGHAIDGLFMGCYYGAARLSGRKSVATLLVPVLLHGFYDFCLSMDSIAFTGLFFIFEIIITVTAVKKIKKLSAEDTPVY